MIRIQNIYYMLAYAFSALNEQGYQNIATEEFENTADLFAAILSRGISSQLKRGLGKEYIPRTEALSAPRGKIDITSSLKTRSVLSRQLVCSYDEFSPNTLMNRIIKTTVSLLMHADIGRSRKKELRHLMMYFADVDTVDLHTVNWNQRYNRQNQTYRMLIGICWLTWKGLLQTQSNGSVKLMDFLDEQHMYRLYEKFILEYYRKEHPELRANPDVLHWQLDDDIDTFLPAMITDITLKKGDKVLIIDAKYYGGTLANNQGSLMVHSANLYQIFAYVKNKDEELRRAGKSGEVSGMLLYAGTDEAVQPNQTYLMNGNAITVRTLDLGREFREIKEQLEEICRIF